jgi:lipopolysaccharide heptosyltransferase II
VTGDRYDTWAGARNVLGVRLDGMGDVLMTSPALRAIHGDHGQRRLTLLASSAGAKVAHLIPELEDVIVYDAPWMKATATAADHGNDREMIDVVRRRGFDAAIIFTVYSQNPLPAALLCTLADVPLRLAHCRENAYDLLSDRLPEIEPNQLTRHETRRQLDLVAAVGYTTSDERMSLHVPADAEERAAEALTSLGLAGRSDWVVIHPGATASSRRYPWQSFRAAADELVARGLDVVFTGSAGDEHVVENIRRAMQGRSESLAGFLDLPTFAALLARAPVLIGNNSGPVHLAAAVRTPVVDLYALTNPQHTPWGVPNRVLNHDVPCRNCYRSVCPQGHHDCLRQVDPIEVVDAAIELLELKRRRSSRSREAGVRRRELVTAKGHPVRRG